MWIFLITDNHQDMVNAVVKIVRSFFNPLTAKHDNNRFKSVLLVIQGTYIGNEMFV